MSPSTATAAAPAVPRRALPTNESVSAQHPDLPGLAAVLDPERRAEVLAPIVGDLPMEVARLRLKPGTSVALALRPATGARRDLNAGRPHGWWRVLAFAPEPFAPKADKERIAAERTHLPILVDRELRLVVSPAETDRALRGLAWLRPDSGCLVSVEGRPRTVHTLSYNPDRRWVGMARDPLGRERSVLRMYADDGTLHVEPWAHGRAWSAGDSPDLLPALGAALAAGLHQRFGADRGAAVRGFDLAQLDQAARFLGRTLGVERHQPVQHGLVEGAASLLAALSFGRIVVAVGDAQQRQQVGPTVGTKHGRVEFVVNLAQHRHQSLLVDDAFFRAQRFTAAQLVQHVVHAGEREFRMRGLLAFAVGVEVFGEGADARTAPLSRREREWG